jgi:hypothetical protein
MAMDGKSGQETTVLVQSRQSLEYHNTITHKTVNRFQVSGKADHLERAYLTGNQRVINHVQVHVTDDGEISSAYARVAGKCLRTRSSRCKPAVCNSPYFSNESSRRQLTPLLERISYGLGLRYHHLMKSRYCWIPMAESDAFFVAILQGWAYKTQQTFSNMRDA